MRISMVAPPGECLPISPIEVLEERYKLPRWGLGVKLQPVNDFVHIRVEKRTSGASNLLLIVLTINVIYAQKQA